VQIKYTKPGKLLPGNYAKPGKLLPGNYEVAENRKHFWKRRYGHCDFNNLENPCCSRLCIF
jgi:hypothetical protein